MKTESPLAKMKQEAQSAPDVSVIRSRYGYEVDGEFLRRVTTLCGGIPKPWLGGWAAKMVAEFAVDNFDVVRSLLMANAKTDAIKLLKGAPWSKRDDAGDRGTAVHHALEAVVRKQPFPDGLNEDELACAVAARDFLAGFMKRPLASELTVISRTHGYAGTLDLWCEAVDGLRWIVDFKTSSSIYVEHAVQQAAYHNAEYAVVNKRLDGDEKWLGKVVHWGPEMADALGILHVTPDGAVLYPIRYTDRLWNVFRAAAFTKAWQLDTDDFAGKRPRERVFDDPYTLEEA